MTAPFAFFFNFLYFSRAKHQKPKNLPPKRPIGLNAAGDENRPKPNRGIGLSSFAKPNDFRFCYEKL